MDAAAPQLGDDRGLLRNHLERHTVQVRLILDVVVRVPLQLQRLVRDPLVEHERPAAGLGLVQLAAALLDLFLRDDPAPARGEARQDRGVRVLERDPVACTGPASQRRQCCHQRAPERRVRRIKNPIEAVLHVGGGQLAAVVELDALPEGERVGLPVGRDLPLLGQVRLDAHVLIGLDQVAVHVLGDPGSGELVELVRIEPGRLGGRSDDERAAALGRGCRRCRHRRRPGSAWRQRPAPASPARLAGSARPPAPVRPGRRSAWVGRPSASGGACVGGFGGAGAAPQACSRPATRPEPTSRPAERRS